MDVDIISVIVRCLALRRRQQSALACIRMRIRTLAISTVIALIVFFAVAVLQARAVNRQAQALRVGMTLQEVMSALDGWWMVNAHPLGTGTGRGRARGRARNTTATLAAMASLCSRRLLRTAARRTVASSRGLSSPTWRALDRVL